MSATAASPCPAPDAAAPANSGSFSSVFVNVRLADLVRLLDEARNAPPLHRPRTPPASPQPGARPVAALELTAQGSGSAQCGDGEGGQPARGAGGSALDPMPSPDVPPSTDLDDDLWLMLANGDDGDEGGAPFADGDDGGGDPSGDDGGGSHSADCSGGGTPATAPPPCLRLSPADLPPLLRPVADKLMPPPAQAAARLRTGLRILAVVPRHLTHGGALSKRRRGRRACTDSVLVRDADGSTAVMSISGFNTIVRRRADRANREAL